MAGEIRSLASKSSETAQRTTILLNQTVGSMDEGVQATQDTAASVLKVVAHAEEMGKLIDGIADYTRKQDENTEQITHGIEQSSVVVQEQCHYLRSQRRRQWGIGQPGRCAAGAGVQVSSSGTINFRFCIFGGVG